MSRKLIAPALLCLLLASVLPVCAKEPVRQRGVLAEMETVRCGSYEQGGPTVAGALLTGAQHQKTHEVLCQEYTIKSDRVTYRIRPKDEKHARLLPVGEYVEFRLKKDGMLLRLPESDPKEHNYAVTSMVATAEFASALENTRRPPKPHGQALPIAEESSQPPPLRPPPEATSEAATSDTPEEERAQPVSTPSGRDSSVLVRSNPPGAEMFIDSARVGRTPMTVSLRAGDHTLQLVLPGYKDWVTTFSVAAASNEQITATFAKANK
jgi:PEGA domain